MKQGEHLGGRNWKRHRQKTAKVFGLQGWRGPQRKQCHMRSPWESYRQRGHAACFLPLGDPGPVLDAQATRAAETEAGRQEHPGHPGAPRDAAVGS